MKTSPEAIATILIIIAIIYGIAYSLCKVSKSDIVTPMPDNFTNESPEDNL